MAYNIEPTNCDEGELLKAKTECLQLSHSVNNHDGLRTADQIVADAQKFWNFLLKTDEDDAQA